MPLKNFATLFSPSLQRNRILLSFFVAVLGVLALVPRNASATTIIVDNFVDYIEDRKADIDTFFDTGSGNYVPPNPGQQAAFAALAATLMAGDIASAEIQAAALTYEVIEFTDTVSGDLYYGLTELGVPTRGWGSFFVNLDAAASTLVEVPHPDFDTRTWEIGSLVFRQSEAAAFLMAGANRNANGVGTADMAHLTDTIFQEVHETWNGLSGQNVPWSIHGFNDANHTFPAGTDAVLSNGDGSVSAEVIALDAQFESQGFETYAYNTLPPLDPLNVAVNGVEDGADFSSLGGTTNVQGIYSRSIGGIFIQVEMEQSIRFDAGNRLLAADALAAAITSTNALAGVPEPSSWLLVLVGGMLLRRTRRRERFQR